MKAANRYVPVAAFRMLASFTQFKAVNYLARRLCTLSRFGRVKDANKTVGILRFDYAPTFAFNRSRTVASHVCVGSP